MRDEVRADLLDESSERSGGAFLRDRDAGLDELAELGAQGLKVRAEHLLGGVLREVGDGSAGVSLNAGNLVIEGGQSLW